MQEGPTRPGGQERVGVLAPAPGRPSTPAAALVSLWSTLGELFTSKKFLVVLTSIVSYVGVRVGTNVDPAEAQRVLALVGGWVLAQGVHDAGKAKAQIEAKVDIAALAAEATPVPPVTLSVKP